MYENRNYIYGYFMGFSVNLIREVCAAYLLHSLTLLTLRGQKRNTKTHSQQPNNCGKHCDKQPMHLSNKASVIALDDYRSCSSNMTGKGKLSQWKILEDKAALIMEQLDSFAKDELQEKSSRLPFLPDVGNENECPCFSGNGSCQQRTWNQLRCRVKLITWQSHN